MSVPDERYLALESENAALRRRVADLERRLAAVGADANLKDARDPVSFEAVFDALPVPMVLYRPDGLAVAINHANEELVATSREHIVDRHNIFADPEAAAQGYVASFEQALSGAVAKMPPTPYDTARALLDGRGSDRQFWSETTYFPIRDAGGAIICIGEINRDVTERERARADQQQLYAALQERERRFRALFEGAAIAIVLVGADGRIIESNPALQPMLGYTADELRGLTFSEITHPEDVELDLRLFTSLVAGERASYQIEKRYIRKDGQITIGRLTVSAVRDARGHLDFVIGMAEDITARREAEAALRANEILLQSLVDEIPSIIYVKDIDGRLLLMNRQFIEFVGRPPHEIYGKTDDDLFPADVAAHYRAQDRAVLESGTLMKCEEQAGDGDQTLTFETIKFPLFDGNGVCYAVCGITTDITARKREEAARLEFERKLLETQKLESLGLLAGGIAHDFNNLLVAILGNASFALEDLPPESPARQSVEHIELAARRAADLTRQMLAYAGKGRFVVQPLDLNRLVEEMAHLLHTSVARHVTLRYLLAADLPAIEGDATQLRQVAMNLVVNAAEAIGERQGIVAIGTGVLRADHAYLSRVYGAADLAEGAYVYLDISDTGVGMDAATRAKIFEPFFTTKFTGRGLGLAVVLGIVRGHRGAISVYSEPGRGTTFRVLLAAHGEVEQDGDQARQPSFAQAGGGTVLIIDDEEDVRAVAARILDRLGFAVLAASDGQDGLDVFQANAASIVAVLLDLTMPNLSGEETFRRLRQIRPDVPIILMSGYNEQEAISHFAGEGLAGFVPKPFTFQDLRDRLRRTLSGEQNNWTQ